VIAAIAGAVVVAALVLWVASVMIPVALVAGVVAYAAFRFQVWRAQRSSRL
jgi:MFS superfamily sulfate permease-like transporter